MKDREDFENEYADTIKEISGMKDGLILKDEFVRMNKRRIMNDLEKKKEKRHFRFIPVFVTVVLLVFSLLATTVLAFPGVAVKVAPNIPLVKQISDKEDKIADLNDEVKTYAEADQAKQETIDSLTAENEELAAENEELKIRIKEISDEKIKEIETSENEDEAQNLQIQTLVVEFVKEMYRGNYEKAAGYCTEEFADTVINDPGDVIMRTSSTAVVFTQITNVAETDDGTFLVFLRLNDSGEEMEADYQLDFEIVLIEGTYLISFVGIDA